MSIQRLSGRARIVFLISFLGLLLAGSPSAATSYVMVADDALADGSPLTVVGRVVSVDRGARVSGLHGPALRTEYQIAVEQSLKGQAPSGTLAVRVPGGLGPDGIALRVYGAPHFQVGERLLLFLEPDRHGAFRPLHLMLGAFREVRAGERSLAVRDLSETSELRITAEGVAPAPPRQELLRDFSAFARWIKARAEGSRSAADYLVSGPDGTMHQIIQPFSVFEDPDDHLKLRWFGFDTGGNVSWRALATGEVGLAGGGYAEFQTALQAWNAETQTPIDYRYAGTTASTNGLSIYDSLNTIVFNDPENDLSPFSCATGGVLAQGGPWYDGGSSAAFRGVSYHPIANADVVVNSNLACFFAQSPDASKAAAELFTHELGHSLGLGHSCGDADGPDPAVCTDPALNDAIMRAYVHDDERGARLGSDDRAGIRSLYQQASGATPPEAPAGLAGSATSTSAIHLTWQDHASNETEFRIEEKTFGGTFADVSGVPANTTAADVAGLAAATAYTFRVRARNAAGDSAYSNEVTVATNGSTAPCVADAQTLCFNGGRFRVTVDWTIPSGQTGHGQVAPVASADSGLFYFFEPNNWEMLIKVLNGCTLSPPNYWVFFAATTDVQFVVTVTDTRNGKVKAYFNPLSHPANAVTDTSAFATCP